MDELREELAAIAHNRWAHWMKYLFDTSADAGDGDIVIPAAYVRQWRRQMATPYAELSDLEQDSDREEADRVIEVLRRRGHLE